MEVIYLPFYDHHQLHSTNTMSSAVAVGPLLGAAFVPLAKDFGVSLSTFISAVQGGTIAAIAVGSLLFNSLAVKYGKRPVYLGTTIGLMVSCFWAAEANSFRSFVAARVLCGLCMAPMEALVPASIADIWYFTLVSFYEDMLIDAIGSCMSEGFGLLSSTLAFLVESTSLCQSVRASKF